MRKINLHPDQGVIEEVSKTLYALGAEDKAIEHVFGYLATWGLNLPFVDIYVTSIKEAEFTACYRRREYEMGDSVAYTLCAVFNKQTKKYGFHS